MIKANICRNEINKRIGRLKRVFAWGVENELVPASVHHGLQAVRGLSRGRSDARESEPVKPEPEAFVDAIEPHVAPQVNRGCEKAGVPPWHPHQLRHNAATWLRKEFGLDAARVILGHRSPAITEVYGQLDAEQAAEIMGRVG